MKKFITIFLFIGLSITIFAQETSDYTRFVGGSLSLNINSNNSGSGANIFTNGYISFFTPNHDYTSSFISIAPTIGKQINERWIIGTNLLYRYSRYYSNNYYNSVTNGVPNYIILNRNSHQYQIGIFGRYAFLNKSKLTPFIQPYCQFSYLKGKEATDGLLSREDTAYQLRTGASLGVYYQLTNRLRILVNTGSLSWISGRYDDLSDNEFTVYNTLETNFRLSSFGFGAEFLF